MKDLDTGCYIGAGEAGLGNVCPRDPGRLSGPSLSPTMGARPGSGQVGGIRVAIASPDPVRRRSLRSTLAACDSMICVGHWNGSRRCVRKLFEVEPAVVIVDFSGNFQEPAELVVLVKESLPKVRVIATTSLLDPQAILAAFKAGASGHVFDSVSCGEMSECLRQTALGHSHMSSDVAAVVVNVVHQLGRTVHRGAHLRPREREIMALVCEGLVNKEIGDKLCISDNAVKFHLNNVYAKFQVNNRAAAVARYCESAG
ncbi:MAG: response regulator transcription factor [Verrucomicrobiaceae bacterium]|nr:MAG: response regulator transcription factor [Verrucomicrobiaceae bacterium]